MPSTRAPATKKTTTLSVAVKCRPLTGRERGRDIVRVHDDKEVLVLDPDLSKGYLDRIQNRTKERRYAFDYAFSPKSSNLDVYTRCIRSTIAGVVQGLNATVFAYGSTGSGKTYTMVGIRDDPGLMVLSLNTIFDLIQKDNSSDNFEVTCSYLEVYNEVIYDLLEKSSGHLELREDSEQGIIVAGLRSIKVNSADRILELLHLGNSRRKTESTEVNATSSRGKTYTMVGIRDDPGLMVLSLNTIFDLIQKDNSSDNFEVTCSYLEVYNEVIYDLLEKSSGHLELREDSEQGIIVAGLRSIKVNSADRILELLHLGNSRRKTESTEVNATSSRSHAVLEINVMRKQQKKYPNQVIRGKLALVDLAGSERASETNSGGQKLRDGANINRSLLALANCINALGKQQKKGLAYVPYRNSKLTRILKDGLSGNSQTIMIATISPADNQYHHTVNTLKYADRAKEIKTHIQKNIGTINAHVSDYQKMIDNLQGEVSRLRKELAEKDSQLNAKPTEKTSDNDTSWLNSLSQETSENVQERINLQKALIELEETNLRNRKELQHLDDAIARQQVIENDGAVVQALQARRQVILDNIRDNDELDVSYHKEIEENEKRRCQLQAMIDEAIRNNGNKSYLGILSQYRLLGISNTELQFEMAIRDQIIYSQREAQRNLWNLLTSLGLDEKHIVELGAKQGITFEDIQMSAPFGLSNCAHSPNPYSERYPPSHHSVLNGQPSAASSPGFSPQDGEFSLRSPAVEKRNIPPGFFREEHHSSYYYISANQQWYGNQPSSCFSALHQQQDSWVVNNRQEVNMDSCIGMGSKRDASRGYFGNLPADAASKFKGRRQF